MTVHDKKLRQLICLTVDRHWAKNNGRLRLADVRNEVRVTRPYRNWDELEIHTACNAHLSNAIKDVMKEPMSEHFKETNGIYVPRKYREIISGQPRGFYNRATGEWIDSLLATPEDWEEGEDARMDLAKQVVSAAEPFKENARLLRSEKARCWLDLLKRGGKK